VTPGLARLGWRPRQAEALAALGDDALVPARVLAVDRGRLLLHDGTAEREATVGGRLHHEGTEPVTGDWVALSPDGAVRAVLPRHGVLSRAAESGPPQVLLANVDHVLVAHAAEDPQRHRVVRFLALAGEAGVPATVLMTKADKLDDAGAGVAELEAVTGGRADVLPVSTRSGANVEAVRSLIAPGTTGAIIGVSGAGKSTLVNALLGEERQATGAVRERDGRGRHVTVRRELLTLPGGGILADTPGLRLVRVRGGIDEAFDDITELAADCRFNDCSHTVEPGCAVQAAIAEGRLDPARLDAATKLAAEAEQATAREEAIVRRNRDRRRRPEGG
jgi:ribosome biogenesis GTPase